MKVIKIVKKLFKSNEYDKSINGAWFKKKPVQIVGKTNKEGVTEVFLTVDQNSYLDETLDRMPYGVVDKNIPGIGATSLELNSPRNSIIVVPTKALAEAKCNKHPDALYVGSKTATRKSHKKDYIKRWVNDILMPQKKANKKIIVVANSLGKVLEAIGEENYHNWFLMIDEVDIIQSDSTFRKELEDTIDWYLKFPKDKRCLVTATFREFSHPKLRKESKINILYPEMPRQNINLYHTDNPNALVCDALKLIRRKYPDEKILVAYNSITECQKVIALLEPDIQKECGIICSDNKLSIAKADPYYASLTKGSFQFVFVNDARTHVERPDLLTVVFPDQLQFGFCCVCVEQILCKEVSHFALYTRI